MHPAVADVVVIGLPDAEMGQQVAVVIQLRDGVPPAPGLREDLLAHMSGRLARFKMPRTIEFVAELPRLPSGKLLRRAVREAYLTADQP